MIGYSSLYPWIVIACSVPALLAVAAVIYLTVKYSPVIGRIFEAQPLFMPLKVTASDRGETVEFTADDGVRLRGSYLPANSEEQTGLIVYCHEYLSDRWSFQPYLDHLRDLGFSLFTFDFRNHGSSDVDPDHAPLQWTTDRELSDLRGALAYLRTRDDHDPAGFGLFGVSRGGTTALIVAAGEADVWGVITDGAFPTQGTMVSYMLRWAEIYVPSAFLRGMIPMWLFGFLAWRGRRGTERSLNCRFPGVESAVARLAPRPWLMIHGRRTISARRSLGGCSIAVMNQRNFGWFLTQNTTAAGRRRRRRTLRSLSASWSNTLHVGRSLRRTRSFAGIPAWGANSLIHSSRRRWREKWRRPFQAELVTSRGVGGHDQVPSARVVGTPVVWRARLLARAFLDQTRIAGEVQRDLLLGRVARHADSQFGRDHFFHEIRTPADFRKRVPIGGYDRHEPYIDRVRQGDTNALFGAGTEVLMFAMTSGTTNRPKTIPVTTQALDDYREGWTVWGILAFDAHKEMIRDGLKPILQVGGDWRETLTSGGIPCGAITGLTAHMQNPFVRTKYCMPPVASEIKDVESKYYVGLRFSIYRDVGTIIAANPSTILAMARLGDREKQVLIRDLADGTIDPRWDISPEIRRQLRGKLRWRRRAAALRLERIANETGRLLPKDYWPNLQFLSNWMGGTMRAYLRGYPEFFGQTPVRDVGLIASEGRMSIPIEDNTAAGILDVRHHYFEFIPEEHGDVEQPETVEATDLVEGRNYFVVLTTAGGLYRYNISDLVRCVGYHGRAPLIEFLNKGSHFSSLTGEKISEHQVIAAVQAAQHALGIHLRSYLLSPTWDEPPYYSLLVEESDLAAPGLAGRLAGAVEHELRLQNVEYVSKRDTLRLGAVRILRIADGSWAEFQKRRLVRSGGTVEQYKQPHLVPDLALIDSFRHLVLANQG